jgi:effector-binding domain-containing protein
MFEVGKIYRYRKTEHLYLCLYTGENSILLKQLSDGSEFIERLSQDLNQFYTEVKPKKNLKGYILIFDHGAIVYRKDETLADLCIEQMKSFKINAKAKIPIDIEYEEVG